mmetsp:Transcript_38982/g.115955  ORF Transcript_38982/g.115955 Transcript_38982/m.115955 type:complete len:315 (+) Transcript_38982:3803-4747(+)
MAMAAAAVAARGWGSMTSHGWWARWTISSQSPGVGCAATGENRATRQRALAVAASAAVAAAAPAATAAAAPAGSWRHAAPSSATSSGCRTAAWRSRTARPTRSPRSRRAAAPPWSLRLAAPLSPSSASQTQCGPRRPMSWPRWATRTSRCGCARAMPGASRSPSRRTSASRRTAWWRTPRRLTSATRSKHSGSRRQLQRMRRRRRTHKQMQKRRQPHTTTAVVTVGCATPSCRCFPRAVSRATLLPTVRRQAVARVALLPAAPRVSANPAPLALREHVRPRRCGAVARAAAAATLRPSAASSRWLGTASMTAPR